MKNTIAHRLAATVSAAVVLVVLSACSTAKVTDTWTAPDITKITFKKVLIIGATSNPANRIASEDATVAALTGVNAIASHTLYPDAKDLADMGKLSRAMTDANMDGVVVMRVISDNTVTPPQQEQSLNPSTNVGGYAGYGDFFGSYNSSDVYGAGSHALAETERILKIESRLYELPSGKLVWTGTTESTSPSSVQQLQGDIVKVLRKKMVENKLIPEPVK